MINVDLPEPETPVIQINWFKGIDNVIFFKLLPDAFFNISLLGGSTISGNVTDLKSGKPLMGANIILDGTMLGSATDEISMEVLGINDDVDITDGTYILEKDGFKVELFDSKGNKRER